MSRREPDRELPVLSRRDFIVGSTALLGATALAGCGTSAPAPSSAAPIRWVRVSIAGLSVGRPRWVDIPRTGDGAIASGPPASPAADHSGAWLVMGADGGLAAFDAHCTHQACLYDWDTAATRFACRCHKGFFALDGRVISGPPPRPLDRFETRLDGRDVVEIAWQDRRPLER